MFARAYVPKVTSLLLLFMGCVVAPLFSSFEEDCFSLYSSQIKKKKKKNDRHASNSSSLGDKEKLCDSVKNLVKT